MMFQHSNPNPARQTPRLRRPLEGVAGNAGYMLNQTGYGLGNEPGAGNGHGNGNASGYGISAGMRAGSLNGSGY